jgi:hypothetical protein
LSGPYAIPGNFGLRSPEAGGRDVAGDYLRAEAGCPKDGGDCEQAKSHFLVQSPRG